MSEQLQVGDLVRRIELDYGDVKVGCIYRVNHATPGSVDLDGLSRPGDEEYSPDLFELVYRPGEPASWKPKAGDPVRWTMWIDPWFKNIYHVTEVESCGRVWIDRKLSNDENDRCNRVEFLRYITPVTTAEAEATKEEEVSKTKPAIELKPGMIVTFMPGAFTEDNGGDPAWREYAQKPTRGELVGLDEYQQRWVVKPLDNATTHQYVRPEHLIPEGVSTDNPELEAFKKKVRDAVIREAKAQGWCERTDSWLEELGLEPRPQLPRAIGAVVECKEGHDRTWYAVRISDSRWKGLGGGAGLDYDEDVFTYFHSVVFDPSAWKE